MQTPNLQEIDTIIGHVVGVSPTVTITNITGGHRVTIYDKDHPDGQSFDVLDGGGAATIDNAMSATSENAVQNKVITAALGSKANTAIIASSYSSESTYAVGTYCIHDGGLYVCNTAISTAEAWTAVHWTAVTVTGIIGNIQTVLASVVSVT